MKITSLILPVLAFAGCNTTAIKHSDTYTYTYELKGPAQKLSCAVVMREEPAVFYEGGSEDVFSENPSALISEYLRERIPTELIKQSLMDTAYFARPVREYPQDTLFLQTRNDSRHRFIIPREKTAVPLPQKSDFVLFLDSVRISSNRQGTYTPGAPFPNLGQSSASLASQDLILEAKYVLYDNTAGELVSYGYIEAVESNVGIVTRYDWDNLVNTFVSRMIDNSALDSE